MAAALIVIEIAAPNVSQDALAVLVSSCTRAARDAECVLAKNESEQQPSAVAIVTQQSEDEMRVEVGVRQGDHDSWHTKDFAFLPVDPVAERWRAVGFAIGTLAENNPPAAAPAPSNAPPPPAPVSALPAARPAPKAKASASPLLFIGVSVLFGPGLERIPGVASPWRIGSALYGDLTPQRLPVFFTFGGSAATRIYSDATGATARWFDVSAGAGVSLVGAIAGSGLELRAQALAEEFDVSVSAPDGRSAQAGRWLLGVQGALGGRVLIIPDLLVTAGISIADLSSTTDVRVAGTAVGSASNVRILADLGIRVRLR